LTAGDDVELIRLDVSVRRRSSVLRIFIQKMKARDEERFFWGEYLLEIRLRVYRILCIWELARPQLRPDLKQGAVRKWWFQK
jgi:hypothetical protein